MWLCVCVRETLSGFGSLLFFAGEECKEHSSNKYTLLKFKQNSLKTGKKELNTSLKETKNQNHKLNKNKNKSKSKSKNQFPLGVFCHYPLLHANEGEQDGHKDESISKGQSQRDDKQVNECKKEGRLDEESNEAAEHDADEATRERIACR